MDGIYIFGVLLYFLPVGSAEYCTYIDDYWNKDGNNSIMSTSTMYCSAGCCGEIYGRYCCYMYYDYYQHYTPVGAIVGIVIGCVCGLILIVSIIIAVCCCLRKSRGQAGQVCQPAQPSVNIMYSVPNSTITYGTPVGYNNAGFMQSSTMPVGTAISPSPMQPNAYAQAPPTIPMQPNVYAQTPQVPMQPNPRPNAYAHAPTSIQPNPYKQDPSEPQTSAQPTSQSTVDME